MTSHHAHHTHHTHHAFPTLYGQDKSGKTKLWRASVYLNEDNTAYSLIDYGQVDGKLQSARRDVTVGKNLGKKNETTPLQQCMSETERKWIDKREKENYTESLDQGEEKKVEEGPYLPMLAQTLKREKLTFPVFVQPKIDGLRCLFYRKEGQWVAQSRTGAYFSTVEHIKEKLGDILSSIVLDGELYSETIPFETLAGLLKKKKLSEEDKEKLKQIDYHCYDIYIPHKKDAQFEERLEILSTLKLRKVVTDRVEKIEDFYEKFSEYTSRGYEGIMVRTLNGVYGLNYRSKDLCKYKEFEEDEYEITGFTQGDGRDSGTVIWICKIAGGKEFNVRPRGTVEQRSEWYQRGQACVGKKLTVIYQNLSEQGIPRFPVGKSIREGF